MARAGRVEPLEGLERWQLQSSLALVDVLPGRGALVSRWSVAGEELLYLDPATLVDRARSVRGGIPILWPNAGRLEGDRYALGGASYPLRQHGFARDHAWRVADCGAVGDEAFVVLTLEDDEASRACFPFAFRLRYELRLQGAQLSLAFEVANRSDRELPHAPGFHPYFALDDGAKDGFEVETDATWGIERPSGRPFALGKPDFTAVELDLHLQDHALPGTLLRRPSRRPIRVTWFDGFEAVVLWTLKGRDFVCVEPWAAQAGAFPAGEGVRRVPAGGVDRVEWSLSV